MLSFCTLWAPCKHLSDTADARYMSDGDILSGLSHLLLSFPVLDFAHHAPVLSFHCTINAISISITVLGSHNFMQMIE